MSSDAEKSAERLLETVPLVMRALAVKWRGGPHSLTPSAFRILWLSAHQPCRVSDLAEQQGVSAPTISATAQMLVERGWLARTRSEEDRRVVFLTATEEGRRVLDKETRRVLEWVSLRMEALPPEKLDALEKGLESLHMLFEQDDNLIGNTTTGK